MTIAKVFLSGVGRLWWRQGARRGWRIPACLCGVLLGLFPLEASRADLATTFQGSTLDTNLFLDVPSAAVGAIALQTNVHKLLFSGPGADLWYGRNGLPYAWTAIPRVGLGGMWQAETEVQYYDTSPYGRIAGLTTYAGPDGSGGYFQGQEFTFGLDHWDGPNGVWVQGLGDNRPGDSGNLVQAMTADVVDLRMVVTVGAGGMKTYDFYFKPPTGETWSVLGTIHAGDRNDRVALFFKGGDMNVTFNYFNVTTLLAGVLYAVQTNDDNTLTITGYGGSGGDVVIPAQINGLSVGAIGDQAFQDVSGLTGVTVPGCVTGLGASAFANCTSLTNVTLSAGLVSIGDMAFFNCGSLVELTLPGTVTHIGSYAFYACYSLWHLALPAGLTDIGSGAFYDCITLDRVTIPAGVTNLGDSAFCNCGSLVEVNIPAGVASLSDMTFYNCGSLTRLVLPASLTYIGYETFGSCFSLANVYALGNPPAWDGTAFDGAGSVVFYYLPGSEGWADVPGLTGMSALLWNPVLQAGAQGLGPTEQGNYFNISGTPDIPIQVEACADPVAGDWTPLLTTRLTDGSLDVLDPAYGDYPARYYRVSGP